MRDPREVEREGAVARPGDRGRADGGQAAELQVLGTRAEIAARLLLERTERRIGIVAVARGLEQHDRVTVGRDCPDRLARILDLPARGEAEREVEVGMREALALDDTISRARTDRETLQLADELRPRPGDGATSRAGELPRGVLHDLDAGSILLG